MIKSKNLILFSRRRLVMKMKKMYLR